MTSTPPAEVRGFTGKYHWASNFDTRAFWYRGRLCASGEHAFNADKFRNTSPSQYEMVLAAPTPKKAKYHGRNRSVPIEPDWDTGGSFASMTAVQAAKYDQHPDLADLLLATGNALLVESTTWHDNRWGDCVCGNADGNHPRCLEPGWNHLGVILMSLRARLRDEIGPFGSETQPMRSLMEPQPAE